MLTVKPVRLGNGEDTEGALVFDGDSLVAILSRLSIPARRLSRPLVSRMRIRAASAQHREFADTDAACAWLESEMQGRLRRHDHLRSLMQKSLGAVLC